MIDLIDLEQSLGVHFDDKGLLCQAFLHASYVNEHPGQGKSSNERLEFLGDAVLECVVTEELYRQHPELPEGDLTVLRSTLVSGENLALMARTLYLGKYLSLGTGEERSGGRSKETNLAAAFEALVGALFLDKGFVRCRQVVRKLLGEQFRHLNQQGVLKDPKSQLQQVVQAIEGSLPEYRIVLMTGPGHDRRFTVEVCVGGRVLGIGKGRRRALAERNAAKEALRRMHDSQGQGV